LPRASLPSLPVHPTQLYEAAGCLLIAVLLSRWTPKNKRFDGQAALIALAAYALLRSVIELVRADDRGVYLGVSTSQWVSAAVLVAVAIAWRRWTRRAARLLG
jgi:phosphatidylglycerol:prolipoprotein diacylglycerol transferase